MPRPSLPRTPKHEAQPVPRNRLTATAASSAIGAQEPLAEEIRRTEEIRRSIVQARERYAHTAGQAQAQTSAAAHTANTVSGTVTVERLQAAARILDGQTARMGAAVGDASRAWMNEALLDGARLDEYMRTQAMLRPSQREVYRHADQPWQSQRAWEDYQYRTTGRRPQHPPAQAERLEGFVADLSMGTPVPRDVGGNSTDVELILYAYNYLRGGGTGGRMVTLRAMPAMDFFMDYAQAAPVAPTYVRNMTVDFGTFPPTVRR